MSNFSELMRRAQIHVDLTKDWNRHGIPNKIRIKIRASGWVKGKVDEYFYQSPSSRFRYVNKIMPVIPTYFGPDDL